ncbi:MAG TPA: hypothetical protein VGV39_21500 [Mesorhizobium sp.]|jgi:hypothetical protein|nr:hypothetical protein [Mesorhizobium sp.]HEV2505668.1 hypothetical protein [Mesorhizobium sp.]
MTDDGPSVAPFHADGRYREDVNRNKRMGVAIEALIQVSDAKQ